MRRVGIAIASVVLFAGTSAYAASEGRAGIVGVSGLAKAQVTTPGYEGSHTEYFEGANAAQGIYKGLSDDVGANFDSFVTIPEGAGNVVFESSNTVTGRGVSSISSSEVQIDFLNETGHDIDFNSTITAAGLGFYLATDTGECLFSSCVQDITKNFSGLYLDGSGVLGTVGFDFSVIALDEYGAQIGGDLYSLSGNLSLTYNIGHSGFGVLDNLGTEGSYDGEILYGASGPRGFLDTFHNNSYYAGSELGFSWGDQDIVFPIHSYEGVQTLVYKTTVYSETYTDCSGGTCLIAYSAFGDPIGRGGGVSADSLLAALDDNTRPTCPNNFTAPINGVCSTPGSFGVPSYENGVLTFRQGSGAVPEPATWLTLILGFGLLGTALRRRRMAPVIA